MFEPAAILFTELGLMASDNSSGELVLSMQMFCWANATELNKNKKENRLKKSFKNLTPK